MQNTREISFNILKEVKPVDSGVFCNSELLYLSVSSPALVSLHRTWKKLNKGETLGKGWRRRRRRRRERGRPGVGAGGGATGGTRYAGSVVALVHQATTPPLAPVSLSPTLPCLPACLLAACCHCRLTSSELGSHHQRIWSLRPFYLQDMLLIVLDPETTS